MAKNPDHTVMKGDATDLIKVIVNGVDPLTPDWTATLYVVAISAPTVALVTRVLNQESDKAYFEAFLLEADTDLLGEGDFILAIRVANPNFPSHPFLKTVTETLRVTKQFGP